MEHTRHQPWSRLSWIANIVFINWNHSRPAGLFACFEKFSPWVYQISWLWYWYENLLVVAFVFLITTHKRTSCWLKPNIDCFHGYKDCLHVLVLSSFKMSLRVPGDINNLSKPIYVAHCNTQQWAMFVTQAGPACFFSNTKHSFLLSSRVGACVAAAWCGAWSKGVLNQEAEGSQHHLPCIQHTQNVWVCNSDH